jgi:hypothetical protein
MNISVACADVGSVDKGNFGWALRDMPDDLEETPENASITEFADALIDRLEEGRSVALGFECPLFIPVRDDPKDLTKARDNEGSRAWSAGPGTGSLVTGLAETVWVFSEVRDYLDKEPAVTFDWEEFQDIDGGLLLWEAFISGDDKVGSHHGDAGAAVEAFCGGLPDPKKLNMIEESNVFSLVGASLMRAGWDVDRNALEASTLVVGA